MLTTLASPALLGSLVEGPRLSGEDSVGYVRWQRLRRSSQERCLSGPAQLPPPWSPGLPLTATLGFLHRNQEEILKYKSEILFCLNPSIDCHWFEKQV